MKTPAPTPRRDLYARVTDKIVADLERGVRTWARPWNAAHAAGPITRPLRFNGAPYRGIKVLLLWVEAEARAYSAPLWMTYKQADALGGQVRKGYTARAQVPSPALPRVEAAEAFFATTGRLGLWCLQRMCHPALTSRITKAMRKAKPTGM